jgi:hypothetical protein
LNKIGEHYPDKTIGILDTARAPEGVEVIYSGVGK